MHRLTTIESNHRDDPAAHNKRAILSWVRSAIIIRTEYTVKHLV